MDACVDAYFYVGSFHEVLWEGELKWGGGVLKLLARFSFVYEGLR